jgi:hypothetical protein
MLKLTVQYGCIMKETGETERSYAPENQGDHERD